MILLVIGLITFNFSQANSLILVESLYNKKDYFNSATEYERYLFYLSDTDSSYNAIKFKLAQCYINSNETEKAEDILEQIINEQGQYSAEAQLLLAKIYINQKNYFRAKIELNDLLLFTDTATDKSEVYKMLGLVALYEGETDDALNLFNLAQDSFWVARTKSIQQLPKKNLMLSQILSSVIPGAGEIYCGKYGWGVLSFLVNSATLYGTIKCYQKKQYVDASIIFSLLFTRFYNGSRNNARDFTLEYNERIYQQGLKGLNIESSLKY